MKSSLQMSNSGMPPAAFPMSIQGQGMASGVEEPEAEAADEGPSGDDEPPRPSGRPSLKVVK